MFKKIFNNQSKTIIGAAMILGATSLVSRFLGLARESIFAYKFGAGDVMDIYNAAFRIPDLVYSLLVVGALSAGFIPIFTNYLNNKNSSSHLSFGGQVAENEAWYLANGVLNIIILSSVVICGFLILIAPWLVPLIIPGFDSEKINLTVHLTQIMFLSPIFLGISAVFGGILQSFGRFFVYSLAPIIYNLGIIFGALVLVDFWGIYGLGAGVVLGAFLHMLIQVPSVVWSGFRYRRILDFTHQGIRRIGRLMLPRALNVVVDQLNLLVMTIIGSFLASGSIAVFIFAYHLQSLPWGVIGVSFAIASFPTLSHLAAQKKWSDFSKNFSNTFRQILFLIMPISVLFLVLRVQIVQAVFGHNLFSQTNFSSQAVALTSQSLFYFSLGLFALSLNPFLSRAFFSIENARTPLFIGLIGAGISVMVSLILIRYLSVAGLALGFSLGNLAKFGLTFFYLKKEVRKFFKAKEGADILDEKNILVSALKIIIASLVAGGVSAASLYLISFFVGLEFTFGAFTQGLAAGLAGLVAYGLTAIILRSPEMITLWGNVKTKLPRGRVSW